MLFRSLAKFVAEERTIPPGSCNLLEVQIRADDPSSIKVVIESLDVVSENLEKPITDVAPDEISIPEEVILPSKALILRGDLAHKSTPLDEKNVNECENINLDFQKFNENDFNTRYLYHQFVGDCLLLYEDPIWETIDSSGIDQINQRLDELRKQKETLRKGDLKPFSITPLALEQISEGLHIYSFEGCTGDEFVNIENAVVASEIEVLSIVHPKREGNNVPPGICRVFDIKIRAEDPNSIKVVLPMMSYESKSGQQDEVKPTHKSPRAQIHFGITASEVVCKEGFELLLKTNGGSPACVREFNVDKFIERGWGILA